MSIFQNPNPLENLQEFLINFLKGFNGFCYNIFRFGNVILFFIFLIMGINLLVNAKRIENQEKIYARNIEYIKKKGRIGTVIYILLSVGFISKILPVFLLWCFEPLFIPLFFCFPNLKEYYETATPLSAVNSFELGYSSMYYLFSLFSLISIIVIVYGLYLTFFNKKILRTKVKSHKLLAAGIHNVRNYSSLNNWVKITLFMNSF